MQRMMDSSGLNGAEHMTVNGNAYTLTVKVPNAVA
jgi:hypothetical protein